VTVKFVQYYLDCLSQASYLIGDETTSRAAVVDPRRPAGQAEGVTLGASAFPKHSRDW
jgi:hypothetical protein